MRSGPDAAEELSSFLNTLDDILRPLAGETNIVCGDFNLSDRHPEDRQRSFNDLFE